MMLKLPALVYLEKILKLDFQWQEIWTLFLHKTRIYNVNYSILFLIPKMVYANSVLKGNI